jgi:hypothetical protein
VSIRASSDTLLLSADAPRREAALPRIAAGKRCARDEVAAGKDRL